MVFHPRPSPPCHLHHQSQKQPSQHSSHLHRPRFPAPQVRPAPTCPRQTAFPPLCPPPLYLIPRRPTLRLQCLSFPPSSTPGYLVEELKRTPPASHPHTNGSRRKMRKLSPCPMALKMRKNSSGRSWSPRALISKPPQPPHRLPQPVKPLRLLPHSLLPSSCHC